jgi:beta-lactamase superfamily II metal-dependent hydrolase
MRNHSRTSVLVCLFVLTLTFNSNIASPQQVKIVYIDVGQGDSTLNCQPLENVSVWS